MTETGQPRWQGLASDAIFAARYVRMAVRRRLRGGPPQPQFDGPLPANGSTVEIDGIVMRIDPRMSEFNVRKLAAGRHTRHERQLLARHLRPGDRVLELGGGIGMVAIECARRVGSENVVSYEANPELETLIRENYALNAVQPDLRMAMVGAEAGHRAFHLSERFSRSSLYDDGNAVRTVSIPVHPIADVLREVRPSVLVVDIQGGEREFFGSADLSGIRVILVELHPFIIGLASMQMIRRRLRGAGFVPRDQEGQSFLYARASA
jgi:FkbM family methyltransferase